MIIIIIIIIIINLKYKASEQVTRLKKDSIYSPGVYSLVSPLTSVQILIQIVVIVRCEENQQIQFTKMRLRLDTKFTRAVHEPGSKRADAHACI